MTDRHLITNLVCCVILLLACCVPATAGIPGDTNGDTVISEEELAAAILDYLNAEPECLNADELSLAAHNHLHLPYGQLIIAVAGDTYLIPATSYIDQKGVPADSLIYEGLVTKLRPKDGGPKEYLGWLAESWECSDDATTWTFHLVKNATWHDGTPFTSADVQFTYEYFRDHGDPDAPIGGYLVNSAILKDVASVECPDDYTVVFHMKSCAPLFTETLSTGPGIAVFPAHIWKDIDLPGTYVDTAHIGTGPFAYASAIPGTLSKVTVYEGYHGEIPYIREIVIKNYEDEDAQILALKKGDIDFISGEFGLSPRKAEALKNTPGIGICQIPSGGQAFEVAFTSDFYPANITGFRRALSHAVNRERICWLVGEGARPTDTAFLLPALAGDQINPATNNRFNYDIDEAKRQLAAAGFTLIEKENGRPVLLGPDGKPVEITIPLAGKASTNAVDQKIVAVLKEDWEGKLGIKIVDTPQVDDSVYLDWIAKTAVHFDGMPGRWHEDIDRLDNFQRSPLGENYYHFDNATFNSLITQLKSTADPEQRKEIGFQLQEILVEEVPCIPVFSQDAFMAYRSDRFVGWDSALLDGGGNIHLFTSIKPASVDVGQRK